MINNKIIKKFKSIISRCDIEESSHLLQMAVSEHNLIRTKRFACTYIEKLKIEDNIKSILINLVLSKYKGRAGRPASEDKFICIKIIIGSFNSICKDKKHRITLLENYIDFLEKFNNIDDENIHNWIYDYKKMLKLNHLDYLCLIYNTYIYIFNSKIKIFNFINKEVLLKVYKFISLNKYKGKARPLFKHIFHVEEQIVEESITFYDFQNINDKEMYFEGSTAEIENTKLDDDFYRIINDIEIIEL